MKNLIKQKQGSGGYQFFISNNPDNTKLNDSQKIAIIKAIQHPYTDGVYQIGGYITRLILNGNYDTKTVEHLRKDKETGGYYFG